MAIITADLLVKGKKRDAIFDWLGDFTNHALFLTDAFPIVEAQGANTLQLGYGPIFRQRKIIYRFEGKDDGHGGRRINIETEGKRTKGHLSYSLRTMKPATNTLITIHWDYSAGGFLGETINSHLVREELQGRFEKALKNLSEHLLKNS